MNAIKIHTKDTINKSQLGYFCLTDNELSLSIENGLKVKLNQ
jgi:hypothetical protein